jgi:hypothetical protein
MTTEEDALEVRGPYPARPDRRIEEALREHIRQTGTPESFPGVILKPLPLGARPELVLRNYTIDRSKREDGQYAPCAQCSPHAPKYLTGGVIWCPDGWLRQFGCDCVEKAIGGAAFRTMNLERVQLEAEREADDFLLSNWAWVSRLRDYVQEASVVAAALAENRDAIDTKLRGWRSKVREAARSSDSQLVVSRRRRIERDESGERIGPRGFGGSDGYETVQEAIGPFVGRIAVSASFDPAAWVQEVESLIPAGCWDTADSAFEVTAGWSTAQRVERVRHLRDAASRTAIVSRKIEEGRQFFTAEALRRLGRWGGDREAALPFTVRMSTGEAVIQYDGKVCQVRLLDGLRVPQFEE